MNKKEESFKSELKILMKKYGIKIKHTLDEGDFFSGDDFELFLTEFDDWGPWIWDINSES